MNIFNINVISEFSSENGTKFNIKRKLAVNNWKIENCVKISQKSAKFRHYFTSCKIEKEKWNKCQ